TTARVRAARAADAVRIAVPDRAVLGVAARLRALHEILPSGVRRMRRRSVDFPDATAEMRLAPVASRAASIRVARSSSARMAYTGTARPAGKPAARGAGKPAAHRAG